MPCREFSESSARRKKGFAPRPDAFSIKGMKRTFCLLATMAFFAIPPLGLAKETSLKQVRLEYIQNYIEEAAAKERLEPALLKAIIQVESNFNHKAVSRVGAKGLMQLMPFTAKEMGKQKALDSHDPRANVLAGARYFRGLINQFEGDVKLAVAAYNAGPGAVERYHGAVSRRSALCGDAKLRG
jgi:soluble lytic murein transglycosylase-like protein